MNRVLLRRVLLWAPWAWPQMGSMAQQRPERTEKPVTFAKVNPRVPAARGSSPRRPRKAVVIAVRANHVEFIGISGAATDRCFRSSEIIACLVCEAHVGGVAVLFSSWLGTGSGMVFADVFEMLIIEVN